MNEENRTNLLKETVAILQRHNKTPRDVRWIGSYNGIYSITWEQFEKMAALIDYDSGFGGQRIASDLIVNGENWWLEREEYDGSEWWEFRTQPIQKEETKSFQHVIGSSIADCENNQFYAFDKFQDFDDSLDFNDSLDFDELQDFNKSDNLDTDLNDDLTNNLDDDLDDDLDDFEQY